MFLEIERDEEYLLSELVAAEIERLENAKEDKSAVRVSSCYQRPERIEILKRLQRRLIESEFDVTC